MKDEEMAEQFADSYATPDLEASFRAHIFEASKEGFLAGLKAGRPQWHDLRKTPTDLPDTDRIVYVQTKSDTGNAYHDNDGWHSTQVSGIVIAWCEIPTFDKE